MASQTTTHSTSLELDERASAFLLGAEKPKYPGWIVSSQRESTELEATPTRVAGVRGLSASAK